MESRYLWLNDMQWKIVPVDAEVVSLEFWKVAENGFKLIRVTFVFKTFS